MSSEMTAREREAQHLVQVYGQLPIEPDGADGVYLHCGDRKIIDFYGGHAVTALGYGHPAMLEALNAQAKSIFFQSNAVAMDVRAKAADTLAEFAPDNLNYVFFVNSGSEANENALRIACKLTGRSRITAIEHGFHGRTAAAGMVTWGARDSWYGFPGAPFNVNFMPRDDLDAIDEKITGETAAVILELVQGMGGAYSLNPEYVQAIEKACKKNGALLIVDEVQTGIGRCGKPFATNIYDIEPDMITVAKSMAGGFPCGAVIVTGYISRSLAPGDLGSTFGGGPLACALVDTVINVIKKDGLMENVRTVSRMLAEACPVGPVTDIQGSGFMIGLRCGPNASAVRDQLLARDILVGTSADPEVLRLLPPLILEREHMWKLIESLTVIGGG
jgi:acetylornithine/N-succinyldiaminopimelate aminotransferase